MERQGRDMGRHPNRTTHTTKPHSKQIRGHTKGKALVLFILFNFLLGIFALFEVALWAFILLYDLNWMSVLINTDSGISALKMNIIAFIEFGVLVLLFYCTFRWLRKYRSDINPKRDFQMAVYVFWGSVLAFIIPIALSFLALLRLAHYF